MRRKAKAGQRAVPLRDNPPSNPALSGLKSLYREWRAEANRPAPAARSSPVSAGTASAERLEDPDLFRRSVGRVTPLRPTGRVDPSPETPPPLPFQRWADDDAVLRESLSDDYGAEWLLETDESLSFRRAGLGADVVRKLRRGHWTVKAQLDLHGLRVDEAREAVADFLRECVKREQRCVRIIHGKGLGSVNRTPVLKEKVRRWLTQKDEVLAFTEARPIDGGAGVVLALLRR